MVLGRRDTHVHTVVAWVAVGLLVDVPTPALYYARYTIASSEVVVMVDRLAAAAGCVGLLVGVICGSAVWRRRFLLGGIVAAALGAAVCGLTQSFEVYVFARIAGVVGVGVALTIAPATAIIASPPRIGRAWMIWFLVAWFVANVPDLITYIFFAVEDHWRSEFVLSAALLVATLGFAWRIEVVTFAPRGSPIGDVFASKPARDPVGPVVSWWRGPRMIDAPIAGIALMLIVVPLEQFGFITTTLFYFSGPFVLATILLKLVALVVAIFVADRLGGYRICIAGTLSAIALSIAVLTMDQARLELYSPAPVKAIIQVLIFVSCAVATLGLVMMITAMARPWLDIAAITMTVAYLLPRYLTFPLIDDLRATIGCLVGAAMLATAVMITAGRRASSA